MEVDEFFLRALKRGRRFFSLSIGNPSHYFCFFYTYFLLFFSFPCSFFSLSFFFLDFLFFFKKFFSTIHGIVLQGQLPFVLFCGSQRNFGNKFLSHLFWNFLINRYGDLGVSRCKGKGGGNITTFTNSPKEIGKWIVESNWTYLPPQVCFLMFYLFGMLEGCSPSTNFVAM